MNHVSLIITINDTWFIYVLIGGCRLPKVSEEHKEQRKHQILMAAMEYLSAKDMKKRLSKILWKKPG